MSILSDYRKEWINSYQICKVCRSISLRAQYDEMSVEQIEACNEDRIEENTLYPKYKAQLRTSTASAQPTKQGNKALLDADGGDHDEQNQIVTCEGENDVDTFLQGEDAPSYKNDSYNILRREQEVAKYISLTFQSSLFCGDS